jgi:hypothetical protein
VPAVVIISNCAVKCGLPIHIDGGEIRLTSKEQGKDVAVAARGSNMTRRLVSPISFVHLRIRSKENVDNLT